MRCVAHGVAVRRRVGGVVGRRDVARRPRRPAPRGGGGCTHATRLTPHGDTGHGTRLAKENGIGKIWKCKSHTNAARFCRTTANRCFFFPMLHRGSTDHTHRPTDPPCPTLAPCIPPAAPSALPVSSESTRVLLLKAVSRPDSFSSRLSALQLNRRGSSRCQSPTAPPSLRSSTQEAVELAARRFRRRDVTDLRGPACAQTRSGQRVSFKALGIRRICSACGTSV